MDQFCWDLKTVDGQDLNLVPHNFEKIEGWMSDSDEIDCRIPAARFDKIWQDSKVGDISNTHLNKDIFKICDPLKKAYYRQAWFQNIKRDHVTNEVVLTMKLSKRIF